MEIVKASFTSLKASNLHALHNLFQQRFDPKDILLADDIVGASEHGDGDSCAELKARAHWDCMASRTHAGHRRLVQIRRCPANKKRAKPQ